MQSFFQDDYAKRKHFEIYWFFEKEIILTYVQIIFNNLHVEWFRIAQWIIQHRYKTRRQGIEYQKAHLKNSAALECIEFRVGSAKSMPCCDTGE